MHAALDAGDYHEAASQMLDSRWAEQVKGRAKELAEMMETGVWK
jgi:lysozyme